MRCARLLLALALVLLRGGTADAAVTANSAITPQTPNRGIAQILNATSTISIANNAASASGTVTVYTCGANGSKITGLIAGSTDTASAAVQILLVNSSKVYLLMTVTVAASSGNAAGTAPVNLWSTTNLPGLPVDTSGTPYLLCANGDTIVAGVQTTAVTSNKAVTLILTAGDF
jgi:hypothetical protein